MEATMPTPSGNEPGQGGLEGAKDTVRQVTQQAQDKVQETTGRVQGQMKEQLGRQTSRAGDQMNAVAGAMRGSAGDLRGQGKDTSAVAVERISDVVDRVGDYLASTDVDRMIGDVEDFARRQPALVVGGAFIVGVIAARFIGASSRNRGRSDGRSRDETRPTLSPVPSPGVTYPADTVGRSRVDEPFPNQEGGVHGSALT